jgi:hypothetical protein
MRGRSGIAWLFCVCGVLICGPASAKNCRVRPDHCSAAGTSQTNLPLKIYRNFLLVAEGQFGDASTHQNFLLDTGMAPSMVNARLARDLGLSTTASTTAANGTIVAIQEAILPQLTLGPIHASSLRVQVRDLSRVERDLGISIAGIIGLDVLSRSSFRIDYDRKRIEFGDMPGEGIPVSFDIRSRVAVALVIFEGKPRRMLVDTGSEYLVLFGGNFTSAELSGLRSTPEEGASVADGAAALRVLPLPNIVLGGRHFTPEKAFFIPDGTDPVFDGLLPVHALGFRAIAFDQARRALYLQK